jgi:hypothetical protein
MPLLLLLFQILFLARVTSIEHYWVTLGERRGLIALGSLISQCKVTIFKRLFTSTPTISRVCTA